MNMKHLYTLLLFTAFTASAARGKDSPPPGETRHEVFRAAMFGAKGDGRNDDGPAIQKAIDAAIAAGIGAEVLLEAGKIYRLGSNTADLAVLRIGNARGLTLAGNRATLLAHPSNRLLCIFDSSNVVIRDLVLDYNPLPFTQARLTEVALTDGVLRFRVEPGYDDPSVGGTDIYRDFKSSDAVFLDGATRAFTHDWGRIASIKALGEHYFEARFHNKDMQKRFAKVKTGDFIAIKQHFSEAPPQRDQQGRYLSSTSPNIYITFSQNVRLERIISHAAPGMTFVATGSEGVVLDGCQVVRKPNTDRLIASNSDGAHFKSLTMMPLVQNSIFEALMDDSINIKISSEIVKEVLGTRVRLAHGDIVTDDLVIRPGQSLLFLGGPAKRHLGYAKILAVERIRYREAWITLDTTIPGLAVGDLAFLRPTTDAVVTRCEFRSQLKTALVTHPPTIISECVFTDVAYGVHAPFNSNIEGPPPQGMRVNQCRFVHPSVAAIALHLPALATGAPGRQALVADHCQFTVGDNRGVVLNAYNQDGIILRNAQVSISDNRTKADLIRLHNCTNVVEEKVTFTPSQKPKTSLEPKVGNTTKK